MLIIHGPSYRYSGESLSEPTLIYVRDHHYNEQEQCFHLEKLLTNLSQYKHTVILDHVLQHDDFLKDPVYFPALLARECLEFNSQGIQPNWSVKNRAFNFAINKPRPNRLILLHLIDNLKLDNFSHTLCWQQSPVVSVPTTHFVIGQETVLEQGVKNGKYRNSETYQALLQKSVFENSCVSLITEPGFFEHETILTEKTIMAIWGGTVPIWVGGWRQAEYMQKLGFDTFDDLVDHSYQTLADPGERCCRAIIDNVDLLKNPVSVNPGRLQHNLDLLRSNPWLAQVNSLIETYPDLRKVWPA